MFISNDLHSQATKDRSSIGVGETEALFPLKRVLLQKHGFNPIHGIRTWYIEHVWMVTNCNPSKKFGAP